MEKINLKILWLVNILMPAMVERLGLDKSKYNTGGWITGLMNQIKETDADLTILCVSKTQEKYSEVINGVRYISLSIDNTDTYDSMKNSFREILSETQYDIIHIFGTEGIHSHALVSVCDKERTVISIQGLVSVYTTHFMADMPAKYNHTGLIKNIIRKRRPVSAIAHAREEMRKKGTSETEIIKLAHHISGRTEWDYACTRQVNPEVNYHHCNEILRESFYEKKWSIHKCRKHSIFFSQAQYPIKGFHQLLKAMPYIIDEFPDTHVYVAGGDVLTARKGIKGRVAHYINEYPGYLDDLIEQYNLKNYVTFVGSLSEEEMRDEYLSSNVFVMSSSIENSPNSLGEAMLLGMPCVASCVGGVQDMMEHKKEGFIYPFDAPYMLAHYVCKLFSDDNLAVSLGKAAREKAMITHSREINGQTMLNIYRKISGKE